MYFKEFSIDNPIIFEKEDDLISYFENNIKENQLYDNCKGYISLKLKNAIIKCNFNLRNINLYFNKSKDEFYFNFDFNNIIFEGEFNCYISKHENIKFHFCYLFFNDVVFEKNVYFSRLKLIGKDNEGNIDFYNVNFKSGLYFFRTKFYNSNINFSNILCNSLVEFDFSKFYVKDKLITKYNINFQCIDFYKTVSFEGSMFYNISLNLGDINFYSNLDFSFSKIISNTKLLIYETIQLNIINSYFNANNPSTKFTDMICNCKVYFIDNIFYSSINFNHSKFYNDFIFYSNIFSKKIIFSSVEIFKKVNFTNIEERNNNNDKVIKDEKLKIIFDNLIFKYNDSTLYIDNSIYKKLSKISFQDIAINGKIELRNIEAEEADFQGSVINGGYINPVNFKVHKFANRESALFLKQQAYARNNVIDALEYKAKEIEKHKEDLKDEFKKNKNLKTFGDIVSIGLSSLYSDNGQNWIRAFICTILFPTVFFTFSFAPYTITLFILIILCFAYPMFHNNNITKYIFYSFITYLIISFLYMFNDNSHLNFIKELFSFLTPTNFNQIVYNNENPSYIHSNNTSYIQLIFKGISYFIGKIAFWYGSVQTVQAFRKFAKGA